MLRFLGGEGRLGYTGLIGRLAAATPGYLPSDLGLLVTRLLGRRGARRGEEENRFPIWSLPCGGGVQKANEV